MQHERRPKSIDDSRGLRAAQYVRMSTDKQKYSIQNQKEAIAAYAARHDLAIVGTYEDAGRSGLRIDGRQGLKELISDVLLGRADFDCILVYDVSRWGRFQDADEGAHYEFVCREAGVRVEYCAEEFRNDGSLMSTIAKALKRGMAGEYSRELGIKVFAAHCRQVNLGFRQGGSPGFGLLRQLIDENGNPKGLLKRGERKYLQTDRVIILPGPSQEVELVRNIFRQFVVEHKSRAEIARELNEKGLVNHCGRPWTSSTIRGLLKNENYVGNNVYNRKTSRLRQKQTDNPSNLWIRAAGVFEGIVEPSLFARAQETRWNRRHLFVSDREMLARLNSLLQEKGRLSCKLIDGANDIPNHSTYFERFGSLRNAYELIDYRPPEAIFNDTDGGTTTISKTAVEIIAKVEGAGGSAVFDETTDAVTINSNLTISIYVARCRCDAGRGLLWSVRRRANFRGGWIIALRIDQTGRNVIDYLLIPATNLSKSRMEFSERNQARLNACRFENVDALVHSIWSQ